VTNDFRDNHQTKEVEDARQEESGEETRQEESHQEDREEEKITDRSQFLGRTKLTQQLCLSCERRGSSRKIPRK
jgi:hypothetical protein